MQEQGSGHVKSGPFLRVSPSMCDICMHVCHGYKQFYCHWRENIRLKNCNPSLFSLTNCTFLGVFNTVFDGFAFAPEDIVIGNDISLSKLKDVL